MTTYKIIERKYYETIGQLTPKKGKFVARGQWADGHLAYSLLDDNGNEDKCAYIQLRGRNGLFMQRIL